MIITTTIPTQNYQQLEKLTGNTYFFRFDAEENTENDTMTASEETIHITPHTTYGDLVTMLIRCKYTLDEELALAANMRTSPVAHADEDAEFQQWREYCKEVAKQHFVQYRQLESEQNEE
ncbi:MAG: hypothetical protein II844_03750 [Prevotella sp.]|nr:hypothetical protein [Prevotella sp.]